MPLSITSVTNPTNCNHRLVTVDQEGTTRQRVFSLQEIDDHLDDRDPVDVLWELVILWAAYRRKLGRSVIGTIA